MDKEDKDKLKEIIIKLEESKTPFFKMAEMLKELVQDEKWIPDSQWSLETEEISKKMTRRNNLILQAKTEMGYGDGEWVICRDNDDGEWNVMSCSGFPESPELPFETQEQAETVLNMVRPYLEEE